MKEWGTTRLAANLVSHYRSGNDIGLDKANLSVPQNQSPLLSSILYANIPQLFLSFLYLVYNSMITKFVQAREWSLFSVGYQPLRVTNPSNEQVSTYFLGLPHLYGATIIAVSILLHWALSKTIYVVIYEGGKPHQARFTPLQFPPFVIQSYQNC